MLLTPQFLDLGLKTLSSLNKKEYWPFSVLHPGLPKGALIELSGKEGSGKTEVILKFLNENSTARVAWIESHFTVYPCVFLQKEVELSRVLFVETQDYLWAAHQILRSQVFDILILTLPIQIHQQEGLVLRRLQIAAEKSNVSVILLSTRSTEQNSWPISIQLAVKRNSFHEFPWIEVIRSRGVELEFSENLVSYGNFR